MENNSFVYGVAVTGYNFTGRAAETQRLVANFEGGINTILISPRRWGKTSLVKHVCQQVDRNKVLPVFLDMFTCRSEYDFYNALAAAILKQTASSAERWMDNARDFLIRLTPKISVSPDPLSDFSLSLGITPKTHTPEEILQLAETIAIKKQKRIVVCIDEFQQIGEFPDSVNVQKRLRSVWQHQQWTSYCLFGSKKHLMSSIFQRRNMPFYQFGDTIFLKRLSTEEWTNYIVSHFEQYDRHITEEQAVKICDTVDHYSAYVQQLSWIIFTKMREGESVSNQLIDAALEDLLDSNELLFMQQTESLTTYQMNFLRAVVSGVHQDFGEKNIRENYDLGSSSNIARLKKALIDRDLIDTDGRSITITDPVFSIWFKRKGF
ncbi:MAG: ATP-binding protein [Prevotella sp.]|nr:ATP-binding protein [Prevotella sp.]